MSTAATCCDIVDAFHCAHGLSVWCIQGNSRTVYIYVYLYIHIYGTVYIYVYIYTHIYGTCIFLPQSSNHLHCFLCWFWQTMCKKHLRATDGEIWWRINYLISGSRSGARLHQSLKKCSTGLQFGLVRRACWRQRRLYTVWYTYEGSKVVSQYATEILVGLQ